jgi:hypothetical protein
MLNKDSINFIHRYIRFQYVIIWVEVGYDNTNL